jgi:prolipoprotein diacylglyceryl transferase
MVWDIDPQVFSFSPVPRWYGLIFASGFLSSYYMMRYFYRKEGKDLMAVDSLLMYIMIGMVVGMRLGHCLFYQPDVYLAAPWRILFIWEGGYASHGGFIGVLTAIYLYGRKFPDLGGWWVADRCAPAALFCAFAIRVGNFFNSEMVGHPTDGPFGIVFAHIDNISRHPAQLYEAFGYLMVSVSGFLLYKYSKITEVGGRLLGYTLLTGWLWRSFCEFYKLNQVAFEEGMPLNMGQLLSIPFILIGFALLTGFHKKFTSVGAK